MSEGALLNSIAELDRKRRNKAGDDYRALVLAVAKGEPTPPADEAMRTIEAAGKQAAHLPADVERCKARLALRSDVEKGQAAAEEAVRVRLEIEAHDAEFEAARVRHEDMVNPLKRRLNTCLHVRNLADKAREELIRTADPNLVRRLKDAEKRVNDLGNEVIFADTEAKEASAALRTYTQDNPARERVVKAVGAACTKGDVARVELAEAQADLAHLRDLMSQV